MGLSADDVREILARSSSVFERLTPSYAADTSDATRRSSDALVAARLERWKGRVSGGSGERFQRYLTWRGLDSALVGRAVAAVRYCGDGLPEWTAVLEEVARAAARHDPRDVPPIASAAPGVICDSDAPEPFEEAIMPFVEVARARLGRAPGPDEARPEASLAFERALLRRLARIASRTLYVEFGASRLARTSAGAAAGLGDHVLLTRALALILEPGHRTLYRDFIKSLRSGGLARLFLDYPVLARLLATCVVDWTETTAEFWRRLETDRGAIERAFAGGAPIGPVVEIVPCLSDPHRGGRTVSRVTFASGLTVMYKPRTLGLERAFALLVEWLNDGRVSPALKAPAALDCGTHGWMEFVAAAPCRDAAEVDRYYQRSGMLLSLAHVLGGADLHQGNVIACGEFPTLVDLEVLMSAPIRGDAVPSDGVSHGTAGREVWDSVLRTGLLPVNRMGIHGHYRRSGGLVPGSGESGRRATRWLHVNTDWMRLGTPIGQPFRANLPHLEAEPVPVERYAESVVAGFTTMSAALQRHRADLLRKDGALRPFRRQRTRVVVRDTEVYTAMLDQLLHPRFLRDGADWSIELELFMSAGTMQPSLPRGWSAHLAELNALWRLDIPLFDATTDDADLRFDEGRLPEYLTEAGHPGATTRLRELNDDQVDVDRQSIRVAIQGAVADRRPADRESADSRQATRAPADREVAPQADPVARLTRDVQAIGDALRRTAYEGAAGDIEWLGIRRADAAGKRGIQAVGWDLFGGRCGIALLLSALEREGRVQEPLASRVLAPLAARIMAGPDALPPGIGGVLGARGLGGVVYGLARASELLHSEELIAAAERAAAAMTRDCIDRDTALDVVGGVAGAALGLLALHRLARRDWLVDRALLCGQRLLDSARRDGPDGRSVWRTTGGRVHRGFAHGTAGITYALARIYRETGLPAYRQAVLEAVQRPPFPDPRAGRHDGTLHAAAMRRSWCQGTAGVSLSCLAVSMLVEQPDLLHGLDATLAEAAAPADLGPFDHVCCGNMGIVALLVTAAQMLHRPEWLTAAHALARRVVDRAARRRSYSVCPVDDVFSPGYYDGLAGVGYELLRLQTPDLPSVLLWE